MSDESSSSAAYPQHGDIAPNPQAPATSRQKKKTNRELFNRKRGDLLDDLLRNLDILIYAELSTIYYMDCSFLRLLARMIVQFIFLTPKPTFFPEPPAHRPYVGAIFLANIVCLFFHIWSNAPSAGEATRGHLHGGLAMDFVGQQGPTSKLHLVLLDFLVLALQCVHLAAHVTRQRIKDNYAVNIPTGDGGLENAPVASAGQDHDLEERGIRRSQELQEQGDVEMQNLNPAGRADAAQTATLPVDPDEETSSERESLLASTAPANDSTIFDAFNSGQIVLADLNILKTVRTQWSAYRNHTPSAEEGRRANEALSRDLAGSVAGRRILLARRLLRF